MKVSIITSCYNREATIRGAIESVLEQDYPDIEYIVVDGASKDNSLAVIKSYDSVRINDRRVRTCHGSRSLRALYTARR